jgi:hypothetical protein
MSCGPYGLLPYGGACGLPLGGCCAPCCPPAVPCRVDGCPVKIECGAILPECLPQTWCAPQWGGIRVPSASAGKLKCCQTERPVHKSQWHKPGLTNACGCGCCH